MRARVPATRGKEVRARPTGRSHVLLGLPDPIEARAISDTLRSAGFEAGPLPPGLTVAGCRASVGDIDAVLIDSAHVRQQGLPERPPSGTAEDAPVVILGNPGELEDLERWVHLGADDFVLRPLRPEVLLTRLRLIQRTMRQSREFARARASLVAVNARLEQTNRRMRGELEEAARVQQSLLPPPHFRAPGTRLAWNLRPSTELAGDILNYLRVDEHHLAFYVIDVCGHGVSSALLGAQVARLMTPVMSDSTLLKEPLQEPPWYRIVEPRRVLQRLNTQFQSSNRSGQYFTMAYGLLHVASGRLRIAGAAHPPVIHEPRDGERKRIDCRGFPIGLFEEAEYDESETTVSAGDRIWCYSDGLTEAESADGEEFGLDRFERLLDEHRSRPLTDAVSGATSALSRWCHPGQPADDCSLLGVEAE